MNPDSAFDYFTFCDHLASDIKSGDVALDPKTLIDHTRICAGLEPADAAEWVERFLGDINRNVKNHRGAK